MSNDQDKSTVLAELTPLKKALEDCRAAFYFSLLISFVITVLSIAPMLYIMNVFDRVLPTQSYITLMSLLTLVLGVYMFWSALEWMQRRLFMKISLRVDWDLAASIFDGCFRKSLGNKDPNVHQVMADLLTLRQFMTGSSIRSLIDMPFAIVFVVVGYMIHPLLALYMFLATMLLVVIALYTRKVTTPAISAANKELNSANMLAAAALRNSETTMAMGILSKIRQRWHDKHIGFLNYSVNASEATGFIGLFGGFVSKSLPTLQITASAFLAGAGLISGGGVIAAMFIISKAVAPFKEIILNWEQIVKAKLAYERLDEILLEEELHSNQMDLPPPKGVLYAEKLSFTPKGAKRAILSNIHFRALSGTTVAVLGPNGSGKTTLLKIILGIYKPTAGFMRLDAAEIFDWDHDKLGPHLGYVPQVPELYVATVAENIARLGEVDSEAVVKAATLLGAHHMILRLPDGYNTVIGEGNHRLSSGQAQLIANARAFYKDPTVIVLDEPNSNLDENAESHLVNAMKSAKSRGATMVFTAHRPALLSLADMVLVINEGQQLKYQSLKEMLEQKKMEQISKSGAGQPALDVSKGEASA